MNRQLTHSRGFTLIELLVVVSVIVALMMVSFPVLRAMNRDTSQSLSVNAVAIAATTARAYATRNVSFASELMPGQPGAGFGVYSGAAAVFTPANEIRITENIPGAWYSGWALERLGPRDRTNQQYAFSNITSKMELNGFEDLPIDYIRLQNDTGVAGVIRESPGGLPMLIPPPFAVWYDQNGYLVTGHEDYQKVYYNGRNAGDGWNITEDRPTTGYDVTEYDPTHWNFNSNNWDSTLERYRLPYEALDAVIGVYVYSKSAMAEAVDSGALEPWTTMGGGANSARWEWLERNGDLILFSRQSGQQMRSINE